MALESYAAWLVGVFLWTIIIAIAVVSLYGCVWRQWFVTTRQGTADRRWTQSQVQSIQAQLAAPVTFTMTTVTETGQVFEIRKEDGVVVLANATIQLPLANCCPGRVIVIKKGPDSTVTPTYTVTIVPACPEERIDGELSTVIHSAYGAITLVSSVTCNDGDCCTRSAQWWIVSRYN